MARQSQPKFQESELSKGELRKLNALRKSVGDEIADATFAKWLERRPRPASVPTDRNAELLAQAVEVLRQGEKGFRVPRGGYLVTTGRGGVTVRRAKE